ncbi:hypothetical protein O7635_16240 [Asanoa sp. WMMD1127]|uniref:hypothetical protein n=1 Tax=Asanoa sp. WMMD1127 TaxID=3016107 RepID=UPI00241800A8|nr:hypothetical protein [Asanoa sp. WMMD1127]MDG4823407.1 hypothetical protein [Asanoa sp. WMMD1127]
MPPKRGDRVAPPAQPGGWEARFATSEAVKGWEQLCQTARIILTERPDAPDNPTRQHRLRGSLATRAVGGQVLDQWQYEVTAGGRIWYCHDLDRRIVWLVAAGPAHLKTTE